MRSLVILTLLLAAASVLHAQQLEFPADAAKDDTVLEQAIPTLARQALAQYRDDDRNRYVRTVYRLQVAAGQYAEAVRTIEAAPGAISKVVNFTATAN